MPVSNKDYNNSTMHDSPPHLFDLFGTVDQWCYVCPLMVQFTGQQAVGQTPQEVLQRNTPDSLHCIDIDSLNISNIKCTAPMVW